MRFSLLTFAVAVSLVTILAAASPAHAQGRFEVEAGFNYAFLNDKFEYEEDGALYAKARYEFSPRWRAGVVYELLETRGVTDALIFQFTDSVPTVDDFDPNATANPREFISGGGDVERNLYGLTAMYVFAGEPDLQLYLTGSVGQGELEYDNPGKQAAASIEKPDPGDPSISIGTYTLEEIRLNDRLDNVDIDLWYEIGAGIRIGLTPRWALNIQGTFRRVSPEEPHTLLPVGGSEVSTNLGVSFRF
jgi:hypothetical protein